MKISRTSGSARKPEYVNILRSLRLPNLIPCDYFLWGYITNKVYNGNYEKINDLKGSFQQLSTTTAVSSEMVVVFNHFSYSEKWLNIVLVRNGGYIG